MRRQSIRNAMDALAPTSIVKAKLAAAPGLLLALVAGVHPLIVALFIFQLLDFFTGIMAALGKGQPLSRDVAFAGMRKKIMMWVYVLMAHILSSLASSLNPRVDIEGAAITAGIWVCVEAISVCEKGTDAGLPPPKPVKWLIVRLQAVYDRAGDIVTEPLPVDKSKSGS